MNLDSYLAHTNKLVDEALHRWLPGEEEIPGEIHRAMRYSLFAGGKRLRPVLVIAAAESAGGSAAKALPAACALELIHTYSLIHDDLPAMDDDDFRRGRPSNHKVFGEAVAVLAGDALLTYAFELLARESNAAGINSAKIVTLVQELAAAAGTAGMVGGQVLDLAAEGKKISLQALEEIHLRKTGALLKAAVRMGAITADAEPGHLESLTQYAHSLGLAFQIKDDILDIEGDSEKLGKPVGSDQARDKSTYPALAGLARAKEMLTEESDKALEIADKLKPGGDILAQLVIYVRDREV